MTSEKEKHTPAPTIAAIATAVGCAGIGVIRISGDRAPAIAARIFRPKNFKSSSEGGRPPLLPRRLHLGHIIDAKNGGALIDEVLLALMPAPFSYTGEDVVEIQAHAGAVVLRQLLSIVLKEGAQLAEPGEFTRRAFMNGRIDLTQAEAIVDLIHARSEASLKIASRQVAGVLKDKIEAILQALADVLSQVEAAIDFPDEVEEIVSPGDVGRYVEERVVSALLQLLNDYEAGHLMREGLRLVILGKPNVGKSSLLNRLLQRDRAIVTPVPGTTRDAIEEGITLNGMPVRLVDTAGLRESSDPVEIIGIEKTRGLVDKADMILLVADAQTGIRGEDARIYEAIKNKAHLLVINKIDLVADGWRPTLPDSWQPEEIPVCISAKYDQHIGELKNRIVADATGHRIPRADGIVCNLRQKGLIEAALAAAKAAREGLAGSCLLPELLAIDLREALNALNTVIGKDARHDVLDDIFSRFCIGK